MTSDEVFKLFIFDDIFPQLLGLICTFINDRLLEFSPSSKVAFGEEEQTEVLMHKVYRFELVSTVCNILKLLKSLTHHATDCLGFMG